MPAPSSQPPAVARTRPAPGASVPPPSMPPMAGRPSAGPPALDPNNPLAAVAKPFVQSRVSRRAHPACGDPHRGGRGRGPAGEQGRLQEGRHPRSLPRHDARWPRLRDRHGGRRGQGRRDQGIRDAHELLAGDLNKAKDSLTAMQTKLQDGGKSLIGDRKYPATLSQRASQA